MTVQTFPSIAPSTGSDEKRSYKVRKTQFGDGYQQRTTFGLNQDPKVWSLTFNVDDEDADEIETFLEARGQDGASFDWSPPDTTTTFKWICRSFNREMFDSDRSRITASFEEVFEP